MTHFDAASLRCISDYRAELGEAPVWCDSSASLLWVDILAGKLLRYWPQTQQSVIRDMPVFTSAVLLTDTPETFLVVSQSGILRYDYASDVSTRLHPWPETEHGMRPNEAVIAPDGSLWFSTMDPAAQRTCGSWYRLAHVDAKLQRMLDGQQVPNTLLWHDDHVWFADSLRQQIHCGKETDDGLVILQTYPVTGIPDGSTLTTHGLLINARWGSATLALAELSRTTMQSCGELPLPVRQPSSCTFGGHDLSELFITSARDGLTHPDSVDGALLAMKTTYTGQPANRFRL